MASYNKLVRDFIPDIIKQNGEKPLTHIADSQEYAARLQDKLQEEIHEFFDQPSAEEMADIFEVLYAIIELHHLTKEQVEKSRQQKAKKRGSFSARIVLDDVI